MGNIIRKRRERRTLQEETKEVVTNPEPVIEVIPEVKPESPAKKKEKKLLTLQYPRIKKEDLK